MTVHNVLPEEIVPAHEDLEFIIGKQSSDVAPLPAHENFDWLVGIFKFVMASPLRRLNGSRLDHSAIYLTQEKFREVGMDRMGPVLTVVLQNPDLAGSLLDFGIDPLSLITNPSAPGSSTNTSGSNRPSDTSDTSERCRSGGRLTIKCLQRLSPAICASDRLPIPIFEQPSAMSATATHGYFRIIFISSLLFEWRMLLDAKLRGSIACSAGFVYRT